MKKIYKVIMSLVLLISFSKVSALEYTYSEWSSLYPSGIDEMFIQSEARYKWYTFENNLIVYTDDYYTEYDGYTKDEASETIFYRYITNSRILVNIYNELVTDETYCNKNFCYAKKFVEPTMVDMSEKSENKYEDAEIIEYTSEVAPMTFDSVIYSFIIMIVSILGIVYYILKRNKKIPFE